MSSSRGQICHCFPAASHPVSTQNRELEGEATCFTGKRLKNDCDLECNTYLFRLRLVTCSSVTSELLRALSGRRRQKELMSLAF